MATRARCGKLEGISSTFWIRSSAVNPTRGRVVRARRAVTASIGIPIRFATSRAISVVVEATLAVARAVQRDGNDSLRQIIGVLCEVLRQQCTQQASVRVAPMKLQSTNQVPNRFFVAEEGDGSVEERWVLLTGRRSKSPAAERSAPH